MDRLAQKVASWSDLARATSYDIQSMANTFSTAIAPTEPSATVAGLQGRDVVPVIATAAGLASGLSGQEPTGNALADFVLPFFFGALIVWISQFASRQSLVISALLALVFSGLVAPAVLIAVGAVASAAFVEQRGSAFDEVAQAAGVAISAAFLSQAVLNLPNIGFTGSASVLAAIAVGPVLWSGFSQLPKKARRTAIVSVIGLGAVSAIATALTVVAALGVRDHIEVGITQAEDGIAALEAGDQPEAVELLTASQENFSLASDRLSGPLTWPSRWVPVVAQHSRALETASDQGVALAQTAARTVDQADVEKLRGQNGAIDLQLVAAVNAELNLANLTLRDAQQALLDVDTPWLLPQLSSRLDSVQVELDDAAQNIDLANHATSVLPGILGSDGQRRYLILFVQPSESREFGGFVGAYGILTANQGRLSLVESGSIDPDIGPGLADAVFTDPAAFPSAYLFTGPDVNPQNLTAIADLTTIAAAARDLVPQWRQDPSFTIDGVITVDPYALAGLLELTGPLMIEGRDEPVDASNAADYLLRDQYLEFDSNNRDDRQDVLKVLAGQAFAQLLTGEIPGPEQLGSIFGPLARADRLAFTTYDDEENAFLNRIFLSADLPEVGSAVDMMGVFGQTATASKLDGYADRSITYDVTVDPSTGQVQGQLVVIERNNAPADAGEFILGEEIETGPNGEPLARGSNLLVMSIYTRAVVSNIMATTAFAEFDDQFTTFSYERVAVELEVPRGGKSELSLSTQLQVQPGRYDIYIPAQASAQIGDFTLIVRPVAGWGVAGDDVASDGSWSQTFELDEPRGLTFLFEERATGD